MDLADAANILHVTYDNKIEAAAYLTVVGRRALEIRLYFYNHCGLMV